MSRLKRSRWQDDREANVEKALTRAHVEWKYTHAQTNCRQMETCGQICYSKQCEAYGKKNAKPMSRLMRSLCQEEYEADVKINAKPMPRLMRSLCQEECEADVKIKAKPMSIIM